MTDRSKVKTVTQVKANQPCENKRQALSQIKRIDWSSLDFRTLNQKSFYRTIGRNDVTFCVGPAGCGKTADVRKCLGRDYSSAFSQHVPSYRQNDSAT